MSSIGILFVVKSQYIIYLCRVGDADIHIGESVFALSYLENVAILFIQRTTIETLRPTSIM